MKFLALDVKGKNYRVYTENKAIGEIKSMDFDTKRETYIYAEQMSRKGYEIDMYEWDYDIDMYIPF